MKIIQIIIILLFTLELTSAQKMIIGKYKDYFGNEIELRNDSTFRYSWRFDLSSSWSKGNWTIQNDTIFFKIVPVYDTLSYFDKEKNTQINTLVLSIDEKSNVIDIKEHTLNQLCSGGQSRHKMPSQLFYKNKRLYSIDENGKLIRKKVKGFLTKKKYYTWYRRIE